MLQPREHKANSHSSAAPVHGVKYEQKRKSGANTLGHNNQLEAKYSLQTNKQ